MADHDYNDDLAEKHDSVFAEKADVADYRADAIAAENTEHELTVIQTVKAYPMASFWAFVMSCTIVSYLPPRPTQGLHR